MIWLQENWWIAAIVAVLAIVVIALLLRRPKVDALDIADDIDTKAASKAAPKPKPLEPVKPDIIAAEPARFKPLETPQVAPAAAPAPTPAPPAPTISDAPPAPLEQVPEPISSSTAPAVAPTAGLDQNGDNLRLMKGVGPKLAALLNGLGITRFAQIAAWTDADIARIDPQLGSFQGRIVRDNWVDQAHYLAARDKAGFEAKYGALGGEI
jgi:predicted flap endonuclease-1-like 5' DNA nuclease